MGKSDRVFHIKRRAKGLIPLLQSAKEEQRLDDIVLRIRTTGNDCRDIIACANGVCSVIARVCGNVVGDRNGDRQEGGKGIGRD